IKQWIYAGNTEFNEQLHARNLQAFGKKTVAILSQMRIGVIGCSGTGSIVIEQLKRLGAGELVLIDPDTIDVVNLNRIIGSTLDDATSSVLKTEVMAREIQKVGFGTKVIKFDTDVTTRATVKMLAQCDVLFGCVDSAEGRHMADLISSFYLLPLFDLGVRLQADGEGGITDIFGTVHYVQPGGSSLFSRGVYNLEQVRADGSRRVNKEEAAKDRYLLAANESSPAVISVNMQVASTSVNDFLARIHPYRRVKNAEIDSIRISLADALSYPDRYPDPCAYISRYVGRGDMEPLLNHTELNEL
ncbi:MAG: ThiF family adenylyltransferase, partial [Chitinophagaceae bacterium]|nr:ThiF family adenylyltransferase [Chitinophagaceae bacterium]